MPLARNWASTASRCSGWILITKRFGASAGTDRCQASSNSARITVSNSIAIRPIASATICTALVDAWRVRLASPSRQPKPAPPRKRAIAIHEVPLEWCFQPGVKLDFTALADGYVVTAADVETELARIGHNLSPLEIVVINTRAGKRYGQPDYVASGCGMGYEATMYLLERGIRLTGTDAWSWDAPFVHTAQKYGASHDASLIWEGHKAGRDIGYCHLEKLHNLEVLPPTGFFISCFPHKIRGASAGWTRAVAIFDERLSAAA